MHVDWNWIKQRPHFIAEGLAESGHDVDVFYPIARNRSVMTRNGVNNAKLSLKPYYRLPYKLRNFKLLSGVSDLATKFQLPSKNYDCIIVTYPEQVHCIPQGFTGKIIYDCMDDHSEFENVDKEALIYDEALLCDKADRIVVSSENLGAKMTKRKLDLSEKILTIRNGLSSSLKIEDICESKPFNNKIAYLGTISEWIDFDVILLALEDNPKISIDFIGPATVNTPVHERLNFLGSVNHDDLPSIMSDYGCYIMPFKVNNLIESVDPVKLYEYIYFGGLVISCYYKEVDRFSEYVSFYNKRESLTDIIKNISDFNVPDKKSRSDFLNSNTWANRVASLSKVISEL